MKLPRVPARTTTGFAFSMVDRALREGLAERKFGRAEVEKVLEHFGDPPNCAFCGDERIARWDHLVPVTRGGDTVLGNMVPACAQCDNAKRDLDFADWMRGKDRLSPSTRGVHDVEERVRILGEYAHQYEYRPRTPEQRLTEAELAEWEDIRKELAGLRAKINTFIERHRARTGNT